MKSYKHSFRRLVQSIYIHIVKKLDYERGYRSRYELDCLFICKKLINHPESVLLMTPLSNKRYIKNDEHGIFITIEGQHVNVINHKYSYTVSITEKTKTEIIDLFNHIIEKQRLMMEEEISSNIKHSLKNILHSLD
jgi:hypothetical protein